MIDTIIRKLGRDAMLAPGDHPMSIDDLLRSDLVLGPPSREKWDRDWRSHLVDNLEILAGQLWRVGIEEIYIGGSFVEAKDHPADIDGYFVCDRTAYKSRQLHNALNALDPFKAWTWRNEHRSADESGHLRLPLYHHYRVELFPHYGQAKTGFVDRDGRDIDFPTLYRRTRGTHLARGMIRLSPKSSG